MRVLFASGIDGFCHRYAVLHRVEQVRRSGGDATVLSYLDPRLEAEAARHDLLFLYRVPETHAVARAIDRARGAGRAVVGAIDDLVFLDDPSLFPAIAAGPAAERDAWFDGLRRYRATLDRCDAVVVSTPALLDEARAAGLPATLHRNSVSAVELALGDAAARDTEGRARLRAEVFPGAGADAVVLGYLSGTASHDRDLAVAVPALAGLLDGDPCVHLLLVGPVDPGLHLSGRSGPGARVARRPLVPWTDLARWTAACDVVVAPLDLAGRFAAAKGEIKWMEAATCSVPTVASPSSAFRDAIRSGETGFLARDGREWWSLLLEICSDPALRRRLGGAARIDVEAHHGPAARARELATLLDDAVAAARSGRAPSRSGPSPWDEPSVRVALEPDAHPGAIRPSVPLRESPPLCGGHAIEQDVVVQRDGLLRVDLHVVTYGLRSGGELELALSSGDGRELARTRIPAADLPDRAWVSLDVPVQRSSAGLACRLRVAMLGAPRDAASVGLGESAAGTGVARLDGEPLDGALVLRGFAAWGDALAGEAAARSSGATGAVAPGIAP